jgi:hypothetical protein
VLFRSVTIQNGGDYVDNGFRLEVSGSARIVGDTQITGSLIVTGTVVSETTPLVSGSSQIEITGTTGYSTFSSSLSSSIGELSSSVASTNLGQNNRLDSIEGVTGSYATTGSNIFIGNQTITGSLNVSGSILQNGGSLAVQDGTILYHNIRWFTPTSTVNTSGTTVTSVGTQFTSTMVGAKLTISGESKIITAYTSTTQVTVASAYSQNYSGIAAGSWGVYSKSLTFDTADNTTRSGGFRILGNDGTANLSAVYDRIETNLKISDSQNNATFQPSSVNTFALGGDKNIVWYPTAAANAVNGTRDLGLRRNNTGSLEIFNGVTADGTLANRRDLLLRDITGSNARFSGDMVIQGNLTAQQLIISSSVTYLTESFASGSHKFGDTLDDTHQFTGSVLITGSLSVSDTLIVSSSQITNKNVIELSSGNQDISTTLTGSYTSAFCNYTVSSGSNARAGQIMVVWNGSSITYTDNSTTDIGLTKNVEFTASLNTGNVVISTVLPTNGWSIKTLMNLL